MSLMDEPITRQEMYLSYLNGNTDIALPEPITRIERYLYALCMNGGGSGGLGGDGEMNKINSIKVNGVTQSIALDKSVNIKVPTKTSELDNDNNFVTEADTEQFEISIKDDGNLYYTDGLIISEKGDDLS